MWRVSYRILRAVSAVGFWFERHLSGPGGVALGTLIVAGALGADTHQTLAYQVFAFLLALLLIGFTGAAFMRPRFEANREAPRVVTAGQEFSYRVSVRNIGTRRADGLSLLDEAADPRPSFDTFRSQLRFPTYRGWWRLMMRAQPALIEEVDVPALDPGAGAEVSVKAFAARRGTAVLESLSVARAEPLGLFRAACRIDSPARIVVLPKRYRLPEVTLAGSRRYQHGGVSLASSVGDSEEFMSLRDYRPGDPLQRIHWKSFARSGDPVVREYHDEFFERHALILDTFCPSRMTTAFEEAVSIAASFAFTLDTQDCLLDLVFVGAEPYRFTAGRGQLHEGQLLEILAGVRPCADKPFSRLTESVTAQRGELSGCILILLAWDDERRRLVERLRSAGVPLIVMAVLEGESAIPPERPPWLKVLLPGRVQEGLAAL